MNFRIGGINISLMNANDHDDFPVEARFQDFISSGPPDVRLRVHQTVPPVAGSAKLVFDTGLNWTLFQQENHRILKVRSATRDPYGMAIFDSGCRTGDFYISGSPDDPDRPGFPLTYPLGELFMLNLLSQGYGLMIHACGLRLGANGLLFSGPSGAGKTTTARLWFQLDGVQVLSDDRVILRQQDGQFWVHGTPWPGEGGLYSPQSAPLKGIFLLRHSRQNQARQIDPVTGVTRVLTNSHLPLWDPPGMKFTLDFLAQMLSVVPIYELGFLPETSAVDYVRCLLAI